MCMLYAFNSGKYYELNKSLQQFFSFSNKHPHGWGLAFYRDGNELSLIKKDEAAYISKTVKEIVSRSIPGKLMIAHIRYKTFGEVKVENTHPFVKKINGEKWVFAHNGSILVFKLFDTFLQQEVKGDTDSERIFCYIAQKLCDKNNKRLEYKIKVIEKVIKELAPYGKLNLLLSDGNYLFVHTNYKNSLYKHGKRDYVCFSTRPLTDVVKKDEWSSVELNRLFVYKDGKMLYKGRSHGYEYIRKPKTYDRSEKYV